MVRRPAFINKINQLGYSYRKQQRRTLLYKCGRTGDYILLPRCDELDDAFVISCLRKAGETLEEARRFIAEANA